MLSRTAAAALCYAALSLLLLCPVQSFVGVAFPAPLLHVTSPSLSSTSTTLYSKVRKPADGSRAPPKKKKELKITFTDGPDDAVPDTTDSPPDSPTSSKPLLVRAAFGEVISRPPVWMMRQAGRHMAAYRSLVQRYPTFKERSEIPEVAAEISLQPWKAYGTDACILFSDILTPLSGMGVNFAIEEKKGPVLQKVDSWDAAKSLTPLDPTVSTPFVGAALKAIKAEVSPSNAAVIGFVGCPFTLATYLVEGGGGSATDFKATKQMMSKDPGLMHHLLERLAESISNYAIYQIEAGADVIQLFDSWAGCLSPVDYDLFAAPYQKQIIQAIKAAHPEVPTIIYVKNSGALLERLALVGANVVSLDWTVSMREARRRIDVSKQTEKKGGALAGGRNRVNVQGNLDPAMLFAPDNVLVERTKNMIEEAGYRGHIANLGHGVDATTSEDKARLFVETVKNHKYEKKLKPFTLKEELKVKPKPNPDKKKSEKKFVFINDLAEKFNNLKY